MAGSRRSSLYSLIERLLEDGKSLPFEGVVRVLQESHHQHKPVGFDGPPRTEAIRFKQNPSLGFAASDLAGVRRVADDGSGFRGFEIVTNFLGLAGVDSPLPPAYLEAFLHEAEDEPDSLMIGLLDLFHHRLVSLLARVLTKYRHAGTYRADGSDRLSDRIAELAGGAADPNLDAGLRARFAGVFMQQARSEAQIESVLGSWFDDVAISVDSCVPRWVQVPADQRLRVGQANHQLGVDAVLGEFIRDASSTFAITVGPLDDRQFNEFLPNGQAAAELRSLLAQSEVDSLGVRVQLILDDEVRPARLSTDPDQAAALGWSSWLVGNISRPATITYTWEDVGS